MYSKRATLKTFYGRILMRIKRRLSNSYKKVTKKISQTKYVKPHKISNYIVSPHLTTTNDLRLLSSYDQQPYDYNLIDQNKLSLPSVVDDYDFFSLELMDFEDQQDDHDEQGDETLNYDYIFKQIFSFY